MAIEGGSAALVWAQIMQNGNFLVSNSVKVRQSLKRFELLRQCRQERIVSLIHIGAVLIVERVPQ